MQADRINSQPLRLDLHAQEVLEIGNAHGREAVVGVAPEKGAGDEQVHAPDEAGDQTTAEDHLHGCGAKDIGGNAVPARIGRGHRPAQARDLQRQDAEKHRPCARTRPGQIGPDQEDDPGEANREAGPLPQVEARAVWKQRVDGDHPEGRGRDDDSGQPAGQVLLRPHDAAVAKTDEQHAKQRERGPRRRPGYRLASRLEHRDEHGPAHNPSEGGHQERRDGVEGHTDAVGADVDNLSLSDRRAESVAQILSESFGVPPENLVTQGYGEQYPKIEVRGPERANRRVAVRRITPLMSER